MNPSRLGRADVAGALNRLIRYSLAHPIGRRQPVRTLARIAVWQMRSRLSARPLRHPWVNDSVLIVRRGMVGATGNIYLGLHEFPDMGFLLHFLREGDLFLDIGANVGTYTVLASAVRGATSWSFEPDPGTAAHLRANVAANGIKSRVTIHGVALSDREGEIAFTRGLDAVNHVATDADADVQIVPSRRLDAVVGDADPVLIKMDVEGHESAVFAAADAVLAKPSLLALQSETVEPAVLAQLERHGFRRRHYDPFTRRLTATAPTYAANNSLFVRDEDAVVARLMAAPPARVAGIAI